MLRLFTGHFAGLVLVSFLAGNAAALVVQEPVTPASIKEKDSKFSVTAEKSKEGLIQFTITYRVTEPQYLVAHFELRDGATVLAKTDSPSFARETSATYYVAVSPGQLAGATFELSQNWFVNSGGQPIPEPGGNIFHINLQAFGENAPAAKSD